MEGSASTGMTLVCLGKEVNKGKAGGTRRRAESGIVVGAGMKECWEVHLGQNCVGL